MHKYFPSIVRGKTKADLQLKLDSPRFEHQTAINSSRESINRNIFAVIGGKIDTFFTEISLLESSSLSLGGLFTVS